MTQQSKVIEVQDIEDDITLVTFRITRILDDPTVNALGQELFALAKEGKTKILIHFKGLDYLSTAALGKLISLNKITEEAGGKLVFCSINPDISEVFEITRLDRLFYIQSDLPGGISVFN